jgi:hypothetical protein
MSFNLKERKNQKTTCKKTQHQLAKGRPTTQKPHTTNPKKKALHKMK